MKSMKSAKEFYVPPPPGKYPSKIVEASAEISKKGASMIKVVLEVRQPEQWAGHQATDYIITDGTSGGGGIGKQKLRGLGVDVDSSDDEIPDSVICQRLLGQEVLVEYDNEAKNTESVKGSGNYDKKMTAVDPTTGLEVVLQKLIVKGYFKHSVGGALTQAPALQQMAPQGMVAGGVQQLPQQMLGQPGMPPQGYYQQPGMVPQQQMAPPQWAQQQLAQQPQQQWQGQAAPQQMVQQGPPPGWAPQAQGQLPGPNGQAVPPWIAQQQQAPAEEPAKAKRGKKAE